MESDENRVAVKMSRIYVVWATANLGVLFMVHNFAVGDRK
jgi:hypothetical protein